MTAMRVIALAAALALAGLARADSLTAPPGVSSVNGAQGDVTIPTVQVSPALDISSGSLGWAFPKPFANPPTCSVSIVSQAAGTVFSAPVTTAISPSAVTVALRAALAAPTVASLGVVVLWTNPPAGTTATLSCIGALP